MHFLLTPNRLVQHQQLVNRIRLKPLQDEQIITYHSPNSFNNILIITINPSPYTDTLKKMELVVLHHLFSPFSYTLFTYITPSSTTPLLHNSPPPSPSSSCNLSQWSLGALKARELSKRRYTRMP
jgi:hypothetical protein